ncbi:MAG: isochorismatase family protein [Paracoccaceae bacterium]|nr:isochorismatase family protein [Paracoccaceae bacterium]
MAHTARDSAFLRLIDLNAVPDPIGTGFEFTEGPVWHPTEQFLFFSDIPGNVRRAWDPAGGVTEIQRPCHKGNGMTYDADLNLLVCEHETSRVVRFTPDGAEEVVAERFEGKQLNSPNDIVVHSDGSIWFTDPTYGRMPGFGLERPVELGFQGVYRVPPGGGAPELMVNRTTFDQPNGLTFSPCERYLYVNDTVQTNIRRFDVGRAGALSNERILASGISDPEREGVPDGLKCDAEGNIWCTAPGGIWVYAPSGYLLGEIALPENCANFHWGGPGWKTLYCTATTSVYALPVKVGPRAEPFMGAKPDESTDLDLSRAALIIQDMQVDAVGETGAAADSGAPEHCKAQNCVAHIAALAEACRAKGLPVIHVHFVIDPVAPGMTMNAPLFEFLRDTGAHTRGTPGAAPVDGLAPERGDLVIEKNRMSPWETTPLETVLRAHGVTTLINTGAWTNMAVEHTARTGADRGYRIVMPEDATATMNADWQRAAYDHALQNVATITDTAQVLRALEEL